ncbi:MAG TPA: hypothetical protein VGF80_05800 [Galbitalea sp.]|jgi:hypothetical protein
MQPAWIVAAVVTGVWLLVALFELGDVATVFLDSRTARDRDVPGRIARERTNELFWIVPVAALVALGVGIGIDQAGRALSEQQSKDTAPAHGYVVGTVELATLFLLGLAVLVVGIATLTLAAVAATDHISYAALRREMRDYEDERITPTQLDRFKRRLARVDSRTRSHAHPRALFRTTPTILRLAAILVGIAVVVCVAVAESLHPSPQTSSLVWASIIAPLLSAALAALAIRFGVSSDAAWRRVYARQRIDILKLLDGFERSTRKRVPGLGDRVARALKILGGGPPD